MLLRYRDTDDDDNKGEEKQCFAAVAKSKVDDAGNEQHKKHRFGNDMNEQRPHVFACRTREDIGTIVSEALRCLLCGKACNTGVGHERPLSFLGSSSADTNRCDKRLKGCQIVR